MIWEGKNKYCVAKVVNIKRGDKLIKEEIDKHDAVIVNDVPSPVSNDILKYCYHKGIRTCVVPQISDIITRGQRILHCSILRRIW